MACALAISGTGCGPAPAGGPREALVIGRPVSTGALDPGFIREAATIVDNIFDTLVRRDREMNLVPGLATGWTALDETTWRFTLREGVEFHNGEPFGAEAVKFTVERVLDPDNNAPTISYVRTIDRVEIVDPLTVDVITRAPDPLLPARMSRYPTYVVPPRHLAEIGRGGFASHPVGTGPYRFEEWVRDDHLTLVANPDYWRGAPAVRRVTWRAIPDDIARVAALMAGEVDLIERVPVDQVPLIVGHPEARVDQVAHGGLVVYLGVKTDTAPFDRVQVRKAISMAIDRATIVERILKGYATATGTQVAPFDFGFVEIAPDPYDPVHARELLAQAGVDEGVEVRLQVPRRYMKGAEIGQILAEQLNAVGFRIALEVPEWSGYIQ